MKLDLDEIVHIQETALTIRGSRRRTTVPSEIIRFLKLEDGEHIRWVLLKDGTLIVSAVKGPGRAGSGRCLVGKSRNGRNRPERQKNQPRKQAIAGGRKR